MSGYLLDANVISELASAAPDSNVLNFLSANNDLWIPVVALYEIEYGLRILPNGRRRRRLEAAMSAFVERYGERILRLDREAAECAGALCADARRSGRRLDASDALIAGSAKARGLTVATRNVKDFDYLDVAVANPWAA